MVRFKVETVQPQSFLPIRSHPKYFLQATLFILWKKKEESVPTLCWGIHVSTAPLSFDLHIKGAFIFGLITILTLLKDTLSNPISISQLLGEEHYEHPFKYNSLPPHHHHHLPSNPSSTSSPIRANTAWWWIGPYWVPQHSRHCDTLVPFNSQGVRWDWRTGMARWGGGWLGGAGVGSWVWKLDTCTHWDAGCYPSSGGWSCLASSGWLDKPSGRPGSQWAINVNAPIKSTAHSLTHSLTLLPISS